MQEARHIGHDVDQQEERDREAGAEHDQRIGQGPDHQAVPIGQDLVVLLRANPFLADGEKFLPRLFNELDTKIDSIELRKPTLDDVFLSLTGRKIREEEASSKDRMREHTRIRGGR